MLSLVVSYTNAILVGSIIFAIYKYLTSNFVYWSKKGIVHVKPFSILTPFYNGLWKQLNSGESYQTIYKLFPNEKMIGYFYIRNPELIIKDPDMIKQVLVKDFSAFPERVDDVISNTNGINFNLFCVQGDAWRAMRLKFTPAFTSIKLKNMYKLISEKGAEFEKFIEKNVKENDIQDIRDLTARFTTDVIGSCAFGVQAKSMSDSNSLFRRMGEKIFETSWYKVIMVLIGLLTPKVYGFFKMRVHAEKVENFFVSTMTDIIAERKKTDTKRQDFVDILLELKGKGYIKTDSLSDNKIEFTDTFMAAQAFIFFVAGFETSSTLMAMVLYELAMNPYAQDKVIVDIKNALNKHDGVMSYEAMLDMGYLQCVMNETMRKYPALGNLSRVCSTTYTFPGTNLTIEKGVRICIPVYAIHNDPKYYPEPEKFIPERFTPEAMQERHPMVFLPFGEGPRNCIGLRFGKMQSMVGLVSFLTKYSVEPCEKTEPKIIFNPLAFVTMPKNGVFLKIKPRS